MRRWALVGVVVLLVAAAVGVLRAGAAARDGAQDALAAGPAPQAADAGLVRELAERLLGPPYPGLYGQVQAVEVAVGQPPRDLPLDLPLPPGARLLGGVVRGPDTKSTGTDVVLDAPGAAGDVLAFYQRELPARGWTEAPGAWGPGPFGPGGAPQAGFQPTTAVVGRTFCRSAGGPWLTVTVFPRPGKPNDVRAHAQAGGAGPCATPGAGPGPQLPPGADLVPPLLAPAGAEVYGGLWGPGAPGRWTSEATAVTDRNPAELEAHYARQLAAAGWARLAGRAEGPLAWSTWKVPSRDWQGFLFVLEAPGEGHRDLFVRVESANAPQPAGAPPAAPPLR